MKSNRIEANREAIEAIEAVEPVEPIEAIEGKQQNMVATRPHYRGGLRR